MHQGKEQIDDDMFAVVLGYFYEWAQTMKFRDLPPPPPSRKQATKNALSQVSLAFGFSWCHPDIEMIIIQAAQLIAYPKITDPSQSQPSNPNFRSREEL